jgi:hypothetical protein
MSAYQTETCEIAGLQFRVEWFHDSDMGAPWDEHDGHGKVRTDWSRGRPEKAPGEVLMHSNHGSHWFYDVAESIRIAERDGWGIAPEAREALTKKLGRQPSKREVIAESVRLDMESMRGWLRNDWHWCGIRVCLLDDEGEETEYEDSLWGIESNSPEYHKEVIAEMAGPIAEQVMREVAERAEWEARGVLTVKGA